MPTLTPPDPLQLERLVNDLVSIACSDERAKPKARGTPGAPGYIIRLCAWWRGDRHPSAYLKPNGDVGGDGSFVWGDSGTGERGGWESFSDKMNVDWTRYRNGTAPAPRKMPAMAVHLRRAEQGTPPGATVYPYHDAAGALVVEKVRPNRDNAPKMYMRQPTTDAEIAAEPDVRRIVYEKGGPWYWGDADGVPELLYRLPELLADDGLVVVVEGEKDADTLAALGFNATTALNYWRDGTGAALAGRRVAVLFDHDKAGLVRAQVTCRDLVAQGCDVSGPIALPGEADTDALPDKGGRDVTDWLADQDNPAESFRRLLEESSDAWPATINAFMDGLDGNVEFLLEPFIVRGCVHMLVGAPAAGKTTLAIDWAAEVAVDGARVLYVLLEGKIATCLRAEAWAEHHHRELPPTLGKWATMNIDLLRDEEVTLFMDSIRQWRADLVIIDTVAQAVSGDENSKEDMGPLMRVCTSLAHEGVASILLHHFGKDQTKGARGTSAFKGNVDVEMELTNPAANQRQLKFSKNRLGTNDGPWYFDMLTVDLGPGRDGEPRSGPYLKPLHKAARRKGYGAALKVLLEHPLGRNEWARVASLSHGHANALIPELVAAGLVVKGPSGLYELTEKGREEATK